MRIVVLYSMLHFIQDKINRLIIEDIFYCKLRNNTLSYLKEPHTGFINMFHSNNIQETPSLPASSIPLRRLVENTAMIDCPLYYV